MIKRFLVCIVISIVMLFICLATLFDNYGLAGNIGRSLALLNLEIFGIVAYFWPLGIIYISILWGYRGVLSSRTYMRILGVVLMAFVLLCLQYLWFGVGKLAAVIIQGIKPMIGYFGIYIILLFIGCGAWMLCSTRHFKMMLGRAWSGIYKGINISIHALGDMGQLASSLWSKYKEGRIQKRRQKEEAEYYEFHPEPPTPYTQVPDIPEDNIKVFYQDMGKNFDSRSEVNLVSGGEGEIKDYSQKVLSRNKKFFKKLASEQEEHFLENKTEDGTIDSIDSQDQDMPKDQLEDAKDEALKIDVLEPQRQEPQKQKTPLKEAQEVIKAQVPKTEGIAIIHELSENKEHLESLEKGQIEKPRDYRLPRLELLAPNPSPKGEVDENELDSKIQNLLAKLKMFKIDGDIVRTYSGPLVSTFEFRPAEHIKVRSILALSDDLAMAMAAQSIRIQAPIPGKNVVGIEIPNVKIDTIYMREILESEVFQNSASPLTLALGKDIVGKAFVTDLKRLPHLLIAGTTGSGKSVGVNAMIVSLLYRNSPENLRFIMIDPKMVEFSMYEDIPHLLTPIITDPKKAIAALGAAVREMERRYKLMSTLKVKTIESYNQKCMEHGEKSFAYLVIIIDELADLMMTGGKEAEFPITRIAQMGRACGIHLIVATQRPSADVVTGIIKTNLPSRIAFRVSNKIDSRVVIDVEGAQSLLGRGDMLFTPPGQGGVIRLHAPWTSEKEIESIVSEIKQQRVCEYDEEFLLEEKEALDTSASSMNVEDNADLACAKEIILNDRKTSVSYLQRRMGVGFNKAANIIEQLEEQGFLSAPNAKGVREILG